MVSDDGNFSIAYNGEIYNYLELKEKLIQEGCQFNTKTDTEVLLNIYRHWGLAGLKHCEGMFAFALFDKPKNKIILARDFFGIKPLYFSKTKDKIIFSSEINALLKISDISREVNSKKVYDYLRYGHTDHGTETMLHNVHQLPPAHYLEIDLNTHQLAVERPYWQLAKKRFTGSFQEAAEIIRHIFLKNVKRHLRTDVPFGATLSGGIDSSAIVMAIRHLEPDADINTFSYIADGSKSEEKWIDLAASKAGVRSHKIKKTQQDIISTIDKLIQIQGEPFISTSIFAQHAVFCAAKEAGIKVMLDGQGADEIFAGYFNFFGAQLATQLRSGCLSSAIKLLHNAGRLPGSSKRTVLYNAADCMLPPALQKPFRKLIHKELTPSYLNLSWFSNHGVVINSNKYTRQKNALKTLLNNSLNVGLPHLLRYADRSSMSVSIESHLPFLTPDLVELSLSLPNKYLISNDGTTKSILREALRPFVPKEILTRTDKIGFETPEKNWLQGLGDWLSPTLIKTRNDIAPLNMEETQKHWHNSMTGNTNCSSQAWRCVNFIQWCVLNNITFD